MSDFSGFVCWRPEHVQAILAPDVAASTDEAMLATHRSLPIDRCVAPTTEPTDQVTEVELLANFLSDGHDPCLMAVVGPSGSGKSHLIKWVYEQTRDDDRYHVIYIPRRGTNLRAIIRRILERLPGPKSAELLQTLDKAISQLSEEHAAATLLDTIRRTIQFSTPPAESAEEDRIRQSMAPALAKLLGREDYGELFIDDDGLLTRLVRQLRGNEQSESGSLVSAEQLQLTSVAVHELDDDLRTVYTNILGNSRWAQAAASLVNEAIPDSLGRLLGLEAGVPLLEVMTSSRELLHESGVELLLLVEDFALLENRIDRQLLDAIVVPSKGGEQNLCKMRTAFAITDDPYRRMQRTLGTRIGLVYTAGARFGPGEPVDLAEAVEFVGGYLNAIRLGPERLADEFASADADERVTSNWVPNACTSCPVRVKCHDSSGFEKTRDREYGLYPFNRASLRRAIVSSIQGGWFDPRTVINRVIGDVLTQDADDVRDGRFPDTRFARRFPAREGQSVLRAEVREVLQRTEFPSRRQVLLAFWGDAPEVPCNVGEYVHEAFELPMVPDFGALPVVAVEGPREGGSSRPPTAADTKKAERAQALSDDLDAIDSWLERGDLGMPVALAVRLRQRLFDLVNERINWNDHLISAVAVENFFSPQTFVIDGVHQRPPGAPFVRIDLNRRPEVAVLFKAALNFDSQGDWAFFGGERGVVLVSNTIDQWVDGVLAAIATGGERSTPWDPVAVGMQILLLTRAVVAPSVGTDEFEIARLALLPIAARQAPADAGREWRQLLEWSCGDEREAVRTYVLSWVQTVQAMRGTGNAQAIDFPRIRKAAQDFNFTVDPTPADAPKELRELGVRLPASLEAALRVESSRLRAVAERATTYGNEAPSELANAALEAMAAAHEADVLSGKYGLLQTSCMRFAGMDPTMLAEFVASSAALASKTVDQLAAIGELHSAAGPVEEFLMFIDDLTSVLSRSLEVARSELEAAPDVDRARDELVESIRDLSRELGTFEELIQE